MKATPTASPRSTEPCEGSPSFLHPSGTGTSPVPMPNTRAVSTWIHRAKLRRSPRWWRGMPAEPGLRLRLVRLRTSAHHEHAEQAEGHGDQVNGRCPVAESAMPDRAAAPAIDGGFSRKGFPFRRGTTKSPVLAARGDARHQVCRASRCRGRCPAGRSRMTIHARRISGRGLHGDVVPQGGGTRKPTDGLVPAPTLPVQARVAPIPDRLFQRE